MVCLNILNLKVFLTFFLTVLVDLTVAIGVGVTFASLLFMRHMARSVEVRRQNHKAEYESQDGDLGTDDDVEIPDEVIVLQINGPLFYGFAAEFCDKLKSLEQMPRILILRMRFMPYLDASGENSIGLFSLSCELSNRSPGTICFGLFPEI